MFVSVFGQANRYRAFSAVESMEVAQPWGDAPGCYISRLWRF